MVEPLQIIGLAMEKLSPVVINFYNSERNRQLLVKSHAIDVEANKSMQLAAFQRNLGEDTVQGGRQICKACEVPSLIRVMGPKIWAHLHSLPSTLPGNPSQEIQERFVNYVTSLVANLPCVVCANKGLEYIRDNPIDASSPTALAKWVCEFHDHKNRELGKPVHGCQIVRTIY